MMSRRIATCCASLLLAVSLASVVGAEPIDVGGRVLLPGDAPLAEARVTLVPDRDALLELRDEGSAEPAAAPVSTVTDAAGRYRLVAPRAGMWRLRVEAPGFAPIEAVLRPLIEPTVLEDARVSPDVGLTVQVLDPRGAPLSGASVTVAPETKGRRSGRPVWDAPRQRSSTGEDGKARFAVAERSELRVSALAPALPLREIAGHRGTAARIPMRPGSTRKLEILSPDGQPVPGVLVAVGDAPLRVGVTDAEGRVALAVETGSSIEIRAMHDDGRRVGTRVGPADDDAARPLRVLLPDRRALVGRLIDAESRRAVAGGVIWDVRDALHAVGTDSAGGFAYVGPRGARLELAAAAPGYLRSDSFAFQLEDDGRPGPTIPLRPAAAIAGTVVDGDGQPIALAEIELAARPTGSRMRIEVGRSTPRPRTLSGARGEFRMGAIDPEGAWELHVRAEGFAPATETLADLEPYRTRSGLRVALSRGRTLVGTVVDEDGDGLGGAKIELVAQEDEGRAGMMRVVSGGDDRPVFLAETNDLGRFELPGVPKGRFDLTASRPGFARQRLPGVAVEDRDEQTDVGRITLAPGLTVQGAVRDEGGRPVEDAEIFVREASGGMMMMFGPGSSTPAEPNTRTDPSGWFAVADLGAGLRYDVDVRRRGYVQSRATGIELPHDQPLEIVMQPASRVAGQPGRGGRGAARTRGPRLGRSRHAHRGRRHVHVTRRA